MDDQPIDLCLCTLTRTHPYLQDLVTKFLRNNQFRTYNTSNSHALHLPCCRTKAKDFSVFLKGSKFNNYIEREIIKRNSIYTFKKTLKKL